jgi:hypothetical protein
MKLILMETGLKTIQKSNSLNKNRSKSLSIQISLSGLSFCILDRSSNTIEHLKSVSFDKKATPYEALERLITVLETNTIFEQSFDSVLLIYQNELSTCVPKSLFNEENNADYLKFNSKILNTDFIAYDEISVNDCINVFVPYVNINNYIFDRFGVFEYKHASTILIQTLIQKIANSKNTELYINVSKNHFEIIAIEMGQLMIYNTFEYHTKEDFIYFILFTVEQLKLNPETIVTKLMGNISKDDDLYEIVYKYIRFVEFVKPFHNFKFKENHELKFPHNNFVILNSFN